MPRSSCPPRVWQWSTRRTTASTGCCIRHSGSSYCWSLWCWCYPIHQRTNKRRSLNPVSAACNFGPNLAEEQIQVCRCKSMKLQHYDANPTGEEKVDRHHGERHKLRRDLNEHVVRLLPSLLLGYGIGHGKEKCLRQYSKPEARQVTQYLKPGCQPQSRARIQSEGDGEGTGTSDIKRVRCREHIKTTRVNSEPHEPSITTSHHAHTASRSLCE